MPREWCAAILGKLFSFKEIPRAVLKSLAVHVQSIRSQGVQLQLHVPASVHDILQAK